MFLFLQGTVQISIQCVYQTLASEQSWSKVFPFFLAFFFELLTPPLQKVFSEKQQAINGARYFFKSGGQLTHHISISKEMANQATTWSLKNKQTRETKTNRLFRKSKRPSFLFSFSGSCYKATCTSQWLHRSNDEPDRNESWHFKLRLDRITAVGTINGWAECLSFYTQGLSRFSCQCPSYRDISIGSLMPHWNLQYKELLSSCFLRSAFGFFHF